MRILFTIPHYFSGEGKKKKGKYGSLRNDPVPRLIGLNAAVASLHQTFGLNQRIIEIATKTALPANTASSHEIDVIICTTQGKHLLDKLEPSKDLFEHHATNADPLLLGFECRAALRERLGIYDYYCYLEDDLILTDPLFFTKLAWFNSHAGNACLLQPNRFEKSLRGRYLKAYIDGDLAPCVTEKYQNVQEDPKLTGRVMNAGVNLLRAKNPHSGCYFLNARQMEHLAKQPYYLEPDTSFVGPLESAATLHIMRTFKIYKPAPENAGFLEIEHFGTSFLSLIRTKVSVPDMG